MRFAINLPNFNAFSDPRLLSALAYEAEDSGWDGFFIWDHINYKLAGSTEPPAVADPWIGLAAMAMRTQRIKLGPMVTPLPRRHPWKLAREAATLDHLSDGRLILGVGLGSDRHGEFSSLNQVSDPKIHAEMLDEGLDIITKLWSGEEVNYTGKHYQLSHVRFLPTPRQSHIPIWVAGFWPNKKPFQRTARWDGIFPLIRNQSMTPAELRTISDYTKSQGASGTAFAVTAAGQSSGTEKAQDKETILSFVDAGATWWQECFYPQHTLAQVRQRIHLGPPRL